MSERTSKGVFFLIGLMIILIFTINTSSVRQVVYVPTFSQSATSPAPDAQTPSVTPTAPTTTTTVSAPTTNKVSSTPKTTSQPNNNQPLFKIGQNVVVQLDGGQSNNWACGKIVGIDESSPITYLINLCCGWFDVNGPVPIQAPYIGIGSGSC